MSARENAPPLKSILLLVGYACAGCWTGSPANAACPKRSCWITGQSFVVERWPLHTLTFDDIADQLTRFYRDARLYPIGGGTREIMNEIIAKAEGY